MNSQLDYNLFDRFIEQNVVSECRKIDAFVAAYSPLDKGRTTGGDACRRLVDELAQKYEKTMAQFALNWITSQEDMIASPESVDLGYIRQNTEAVEFTLSKEDIQRIDCICATEPEKIDCRLIQVSVQGEGNHKVYQTIEEAIANRLKFPPSPLELTELILVGASIKPDRLIPAKDGSGVYRYELVEGRLQYWAWASALIARDLFPPTSVRIDVTIS